MDRGMKTFHPRFRMVSVLTLATASLRMIMSRNTNQALSRNTASGTGHQEVQDPRSMNGRVHPPKNRMTIIPQEQAPLR